MKKPKYKLGDTLVLVKNIEIGSLSYKVGKIFRVAEKRFNRIYDEWSYCYSKEDGLFFLEREVREATKMDKALEGL
jgi:hypothetical protein